MIEGYNPYYQNKNELEKFRKLKAWLNASTQHNCLMPPTLNVDPLKKTTGHLIQIKNITGYSYKNKLVYSEK
jgi:hypothetical protein